jgi:hypothetical protein
MFSDIRSMHQPTTPVARLTAALPAVPHPHRQRHRRGGAAAVVMPAAGLGAVLIGTGAVIFRDRLASMVSRDNGGEELAPEATEE